MKTPDKILFEYAADTVTCFHGHTLTWVEFEQCCADFFKRNYGIRNCYWRLLRANAFPENVVVALQAADLLGNDLDNILLDPAFKLNMFFKEQIKGFVDPKSLMRFETEQEALSRAPSPDYAEFLSLSNVQKQAVNSFYRERLARRIGRFELGAQTVEMTTVIGIANSNDLCEYARPSRTTFTKYIELLSGLRPISSMDILDAAYPQELVVRVREADEEKQFIVKLTSVASCTVERRRQKMARF